MLTENITLHSCSQEDPATPQPHAGARSVFLTLDYSGFACCRRGRRRSPFPRRLRLKLRCPRHHRERLLLLRRLVPPQ